MARLRSFFELDQDVAAIRFRHRRQTQFQAGAPRSAFDLGHRTQDLLHVAHHAVGFRERSAGGRPVVQSESAFVHLRHQVGAGIAVANVRGRDQEQAQTCQPHGMGQSSSQPPGVEVHDSSEESPERCLFGGEQPLASLPSHPSPHSAGLGFRLAPADEVLAQTRRPGQRQRQGCEQGNAHGHGQRAKKCSGNSGDRNQWQENNHGGDGRADQRDRDFLQRTVDGLKPVFAGVAVEHDVLDHDDGIVDHQPNGGGKSSQRHQVETLIEQPERDECHQDRDRNY